MRIVVLARACALATIVTLASLVATPAEAASRPSTTTITVSQSAVTAGQQIIIQGNVSGASTGARVRLQRWSARHWVRVRDARVTSAGAYAFAAAPTAGTSYRVRTFANRRIKKSFSPTIAVAVAAAPAPTSTAPRTEASDVRDLILQKTNEFRRQNGRAPLTLMPALTTVAQNWTDHMAATGDFNHNPSYWKQYPGGWSNAGENIAVGQTPEQVVDAWINSPGHRANLLGNYDRIGIGYAVNGRGTRYYTQDFANY